MGKKNNVGIIALLIGLAGLFFIFFGRETGEMILNITRGLRNNNPGNLKDFGIKWQGRVGTEGPFVLFDTMVNGIRALAKDLKTDYFRDGQVTIRALITEFAPGKNEKGETENNTLAYIKSVSSFMGKSPDEVLNWDRDKFMLVRAIIRHEQGAIQAAVISDATVQQGIDLA